MKQFVHPVHISLDYHVHLMYIRFIKSMGRQMLDRTKTTFRRLSLSELLALPAAEQRAYYAEAERHPAPQPTTLFDFTKPDHPSLSIDGPGPSDAYLNHNSADCDDGIGL